MKQAKVIFQKLLHPSKWVLIFLPPLSFAALIFIFATQTTRSVSAYMIYCMAVYYLVLGCLRAYLIVCYRRRDPELEHRCYHTTAWLLFLLNVPMGGMIVLMVRTNSGFSYPGYIIYLSALYTMVTSIQNLVKFRKLGTLAGVVHSAESL